MATSSVSSRNLVDTQSIAFIRATVITLRLSASRPNTRMYVFFDDVPVNIYCKTATGSLGGPLVTDSTGSLTFYFHVPGGKFTTGQREIVVTDAPDVSMLDVNGNTYGSASAIFTSTGVRQVFQKTTVVTTQNTVVIETVIPRPAPPPPPPPPPPAPAPAPVRRISPRRWEGNNRGGSDPLAQSFFTFGVEGGCFVTSIEVYFFSKDTSIPVQIDIRPLVNGYPANANQVDPRAVVVLPPSQVNVSSNASVATKFTFENPVYLDEDSEYCFVLFSNSKNYNVFTSRMGEKSFENGRTIFEQPYNGSMFRSENNITWQAEQFEDIKFTLNVAKFNTAVNSVIKFRATTPHQSTPSTIFYTRSGSTRVSVYQPVQHGLEVNSKVHIVADTGAVYNGISAANISGERTVIRVIDEYSYDYLSGAAATSTGFVKTGGQVREVHIDNPGSNYTSAPTITFTGGGGTGAAATATVAGGEIIAITITNMGSGYTSAPTVSVTGGGGSNAVLVADIDAVLTVSTNKPVNFFVPNIPAQNLGEAEINAKVTTTQLNYLGGNLNTYQPAETVEMDINTRTHLNTNSVIASRYNEIARMANSPSIMIEYNMSTPNENISPVIDITNEPSLIAYNYKIRNQFGEDVNSENPTGSVQQIVISNGGSGYTVPPTVSFVGGGGTGAAGTAVLTGGAVTSVTITDGGTGYTTIPEVEFTRVDASVGIEASGNVILTPFNSELTPNKGTAKSRYITKKITLETPSRGINLLSEIYSEQESNVDWYIRTSLSGSGTAHSSRNWVKLKCDQERNKSAKPGQRIDYKFYLYDLPEFDTYDLKCVLRSANPSKAPMVYNYRAIIVA